MDIWGSNWVPNYVWLLEILGKEKKIKKNGFLTFDFTVKNIKENKI